MAIKGNGLEYDVTFKITNELKTTTSQFAVVGLVPGTTTTQDRTVSKTGVDNSTGAATGTSRFAIGIIQSLQSSASEEASVRMFGVSKAVCAASVSAGYFVRAYHGASASAAGKIVEITDGVSISAATITASNHCVVLGRALESGSTNTVISVFVNPSLYDSNLIHSIPS